MLLTLNLERSGEKPEQRRRSEREQAALQLQMMEMKSESAPNVAASE